MFKETMDFVYPKIHLTFYMTFSDSVVLWALLTSSILLSLPPLRPGFDPRHGRKWESW